MRVFNSSKLPFLPKAKVAVVTGAVISPHDVMMYCRVKMCLYPSTASSKVMSLEVTSGVRTVSYRLITDPVAVK